MAIKIQEIVEGVEMQSDEQYTYLNRETGEIVYVSEEALALAEDEEDYEDFPKWQQEEIQFAYYIVNNVEQYIRLPSSHEMDEYAMMESFCQSISESNVKNILLSSIHGKGAFRRFNEKINQLQIADKWYQFRDHEYKKIAIEFCNNHNIDYILE